MRAMIAVPALCLALNAAAGCPVEHPREQPAIPDAIVASKQEMRQAQVAADQYLLQGQAYLECGLMNRRQYNLLLAQMELFYERYHNEVARYQARVQMVAEIDAARQAPAPEVSAR